MKNRRHHRAYWPQGIQDDPRVFLLFFAVSTIGHIIFFAVLIFVPGYATHKKPSLSVISVSMVSLPALEKAMMSDQRQPEAQDVKVSAVTIPENDHQRPTPVSVKPQKEKIKQSLKKKTFKSSKVVKSAITRIEKKVIESRPDHVKQAIDRLKDQVEKTEAIDLEKHKNITGPGILGGSGTGSKKVLELIDIYRVEVAFQIQKNWAFPEQLVGARTDLVAELAFTILPNGEIKDIWFDKSSGNRYLDESAKKAIMKSNPVRPHPPGINKPFVNVGLRFTPKGVR